LDRTEGNTSRAVPQPGSYVEVVHTECQRRSGQTLPNEL
jgi:hypothetical protein